MSAPQSAYQMSYSDSAGVTHSASYWVPAQINLDIFNQVGNVTFLGFNNKADHDSMMQPVGVMQYAITAPMYQSYFASAVASVI